MTVLPLTEPDLPEALEIERQCFPDPWTEGIFRSGFLDERTFYYSVRDGKRLAGYCCLYHGYDGCCINNIAVAPDYRRQGVATHLMQVMELKSLELAERLTLEVRVSNLAAISLYTTRGFQSEGIHPNYYLHPKEDAVIMTKFFA
jgi:ribosomal-protein-alanine N-acetyltransferase